MGLFRKGQAVVQDSTKNSEAPRGQEQWEVTTALGWRVRRREWTLLMRARGMGEGPVDGLQSPEGLNVVTTKAAACWGLAVATHFPPSLFHQLVISSRYLLFAEPNWKLEGKEAWVMQFTDLGQRSLEWRSEKIREWIQRATGINQFAIYFGSNCVYSPPSPAPKPHIY